eukprot:NODE_5660_length_627_cov_76.572000_g5496_i0.p1 GENE.NODE_5660_length_627_cov_76.572000_g5496_i0~~NODE_5660_length_627_cov_76.572000_g5496_i0.p1  ORF type:complete len:161 (+),score=34.55 NODE_5660_length_627_cov_76.572000_g5496_i0:69-551(+)
MGCNESKNKDVEASRRARAPSPAKNIEPLERSSSHGTPITSVEDDFGGMESYTDRHMKEAELLKEVIHRTSMRFIDIGQTPAFYGTPDAPSLALAQIPSGAASSSLWCRMPPADSANTWELLVAPVLKEPDGMTEVFANVAKGMEDFRITPVSELVVALF